MEILLSEQTRKTWYAVIFTELLQMQVVFHHPLPVSMCLNKEIFSSGLIPTGAAEWTAAFDVA